MEYYKFYVKDVEGMGSNKTKIEMVCERCKSKYSIGKHSLYQRKRRNTPNYCKACMDEYNHDKQKNYVNSLTPQEKEEYKRVRKEGNIENWNSRTDEDKEARGKRLNDSFQTWYHSLDQEAKDKHNEYKSDYWKNIPKELKDDRMNKLHSGAQEYWDNITDDERERRIKSLRASNEEYWKNITKEEKAAVLLALSQGRAEWWNNLSAKDKQLKIDKLIKGGTDYWRNISVEDRLVKMKPVHEARDREYQSTSEEERMRRYEKLESGYRDWWDSLTPEQFDDWCMKKAIESNNRDNDDVDPTKTEMQFMEDLKIYGLPYQFQYYNTTKHPEFNKLFPYNPNTGSDRINFTHQWDFLVQTLHGNIFVDVDGTIHKYSKSTDFSDNTIYRDSQRPYQTDGLDAYVIECHDDKITNDTPVLNLQIGERVKYKVFLNILQYMNTYDKDL